MTHHGENREENKRKLGKTRKLNDTRGEIFTFCVNRGNLCLFWK